MGNKSRPANEYTVRQNEKFDRPSYPPLKQAPHPELRIIQDACIDYGEGDGLSGDEYAWQWERFIAATGRRYKGQLMARSLGSVSLTIVSAQEISKMMEDRHGDRFRRPDQAKKLLSGLAKRTRDFLFTKQIEAADQKERELYAQLQPAAEDIIGASGFSFSSEQEETKTSLMTAPCVSVEEKVEIEAELRRHLFGQSVYYVPRMDVFQTYGRNYGIDLSSNPEPSEQRDALKTYFRKEEGLSVGFMDSHHRPHATLFNLLPQWTAEMIDFKYGHTPSAITFEPIRLDSSGNDDILFE